MRLRRLELTDIRSYGRVTIDLEPGVTILVGQNAQGKTNLLEAVQRAATGSSHRVAGDGPLVRFGAEVGIIRCEVVTDEGRRRTLDLEVGTGRRTRTRIDGQDARRAAQSVGVLRVVLFAPEDVAIVRGDPSERRRFLDDVLAQRRPAFAAARSEHDRVLRQRNQLLKQIRGSTGASRDAAMSSLEIWTEQLITHGTQIIAARIAAIRTLAGPVDHFYRDLADRPEPIGLTYRCSAGDEVGGRLASGAAGASTMVPETAPIAQAMRRSFAAREREETARGLTLVGPHRDDLELTIGELPARGYSSHGEAWSLALALKLATYEVLAEVGDRPIVLLDDVFAELDTTRRQRLAAACADFDQVLVTAAVEADVPLEGTKIDVELLDGRTRLSPGGDRVIRVDRWTGGLMTTGHTGGGGRRGGRAAGRPIRDASRGDAVSRDRKAAAADRDERIYARKRANLQRRRAQQDRSDFDPSPPEDDDWTVGATDSDGLLRITPPTTVGETLHSLIQRRGWDERLRGATAASRWVEIVGEQLADRCEPVRLVHGTLTVRAENQVWATQLRYMLPHLRASAERVLGSGTVKEVTVVVGSLQGHGDVLSRGHDAATQIPPPPPGAADPPGPDR